MNCCALGFDTLSVLLTSIIIVSVQSSGVEYSSNEQTGIISRYSIVHYGYMY